MQIDLKQYQNNVAAPKKEAKSTSGSGLSKALSKDISFSSGFGDKSKEEFYGELGTLFEAGVDLRSALDLLQEDQRKKSHQVVIEKIREGIINGHSFSGALQAVGKFSPYEYHSLKIGEESGRLTQVLEELKAFYGRKMKLKRMLIGALIYPSFVISVAVGVIYFMLAFIVPMFSEVFQRFDTELPSITLWVMAASEQAPIWFGVLVLALIGLGALWWSQREKPWMRRLTARLILGIPFFGGLIGKIYLARMCQSMYLLMAASHPLTQSLDLVRNMIRFYPLEVSLDHARKTVMQGVPLHRSLSKSTIFPKRMIAMIRLAEEVNQLESIFKKLSEQYTTEVEHRIGMMGKVIEPVLIILVALFVGFILVAMYLPLFRLGTAI